MTDIYGNLPLMERIFERADVTKRLMRGDFFVCTGNYIHSTGSIDDSAEVADNLMHLRQRFPRNAFILLGSHEWSHVANVPIVKDGVNQTQAFVNLLEKKVGITVDAKIREYTKFWAASPLAVTAANIFISHAAPDRSVRKIDDFRAINISSIKKRNDPYYGLLWAQPKSLGNLDSMAAPYDGIDTENFLENLNVKVSLVGHSPVSKALQLRRQVIVNTAAKGEYLDIDLSRQYTAAELMKCVKTA